MPAYEKKLTRKLKSHGVFSHFYGRPIYIFEDENGNIIHVPNLDEKGK